jgi:hypothetical protein
MGLARAKRRILIGRCPQSERGGRRPPLPIAFYVPALSGLPRFIAQTLRAPHFGAFFEARMKALSTLVSDAMCKPVVLEQGSNEAEVEASAGDSPEADLDEAA